jgi:uncharacterized protein (DUF1778 family)
MTATASIDLRTSDAEKALIDQAARNMGKNRTAFILENTLRAAEEVILERTRFTLDSETWNELRAALDRPPSGEQARGLRRLFGTEAPWRQQ